MPKFRPSVRDRYPAPYKGHMKHTFTAIVLSLAALSAHAADMVLPIRGVADGDTIKTVVKLPCPLCNVSIRILGIDTPESNHLAKCPKEKDLGMKAKMFVVDLTKGQETMIARNVKWDKYGGRIDAYVEINGVDVGKALIEVGLARPYTGEGPKSDWCK